MSALTNVFGSPTEALYALVVFAVVSAESLIALWAAVSRASGLLRALVVAAVTGALIAVGATWPAFVLAITAALTAIFVALVRRWQARAVGQDRTIRWQFRVAHLLIAMLVIAVLCTLYRFYLIRTWAHVVIAPIVCSPLAVIIALAYHAVAGPARGKMLAVLVAIIPVIAAGLVWLDIGQKLHIPALFAHGYASGIGRAQFTAHLLALLGVGISCGLAAWSASMLWRRPTSLGVRLGRIVLIAVAAAVAAVLCVRYADELWLTGVTGLRMRVPLVLALCIPLAAIAGIVAAATWIARAYWTHPNPAVRHTTHRIAYAALAVVLIPSSWLYWQMLQRPHFPPPRVAAPGNNYVRIAEICKQLASPPPGAARALIEEATQLLDSANYIPPTALEGEARNAPESLNGHDLMAIYNQLYAETERAARLGEHDRAADYAIAAIRLGTMLRRGGTTGHARMADHFPASLEWLAVNRARLSSSKVRESIDALEHSIRHRDDLLRLQARDQIHWERFSGWCGRLHAVLARKLQPLPSKEAVEEFEVSALHVKALQTLLAIELYYRDHRWLPDALAELTPAYLPNTPVDPFSGKPLIYRQAAIGFVLYSVGRDRVDNGGAFDPKQYYLQSGFDLDLSHSHAQQ